MGIHKLKTIKDHKTQYSRNIYYYNSKMSKSNNKVSSSNKKFIKSIIGLFKKRPEIMWSVVALCVLIFCCYALYCYCKNKAEKRLQETVRTGRSTGRKGKSSKNTIVIRTGSYSSGSSSDSSHDSSYDHSDESVEDSYDESGEDSYESESEESYDDYSEA